MEHLVLQHLQLWQVVAHHVGKGPTGQVTMLQVEKCWASKTFPFGDFLQLLLGEGVGVSGVGEEEAITKHQGVELGTAEK